jgi:general secretion pathway protein I
MSGRRDPRAQAAGSAGFTLIEVLVAIAIFGMAAVALLRLVGVSLASADSIATRQLAAIVARNQAVEAQLAPDAPQAGRGSETAGRRRFAFARIVSPGPDPGSLWVRIDVIGDSGQVIARDTALRAAVRRSPPATP